MKGFSRLAAAAYLLLAGVFFLYWGHVAYFADDWILLPLFRRAAGEGVSGVGGFAVQAAQNLIYNVFRMQWLSILYGFAVTWLGGYRASFNWVLLLGLHVGNAWLLSQALRRLGLERSLSFMAGALFLLAPAGRFVLFTYLTNPFFVLATFWVLLMLWLWSGAPDRRRWALGASAVAGLFSGEQVFALLGLLIPLAAWTLAPATLRRGLVRTMLGVWVAMAAAGAVYLLAVTRISPRQVGLTKRYEWKWYTVSENLDTIFDVPRKLAGLSGDAPFRIAPGAADLALALGATALVAVLLWRWRGDPPSGAPLWRVALFGAAAWLVAQLPTLPLAGGYALRYLYVPAPFLAVLAAVACRVFGRRAAALTGGLAAGFLTLNAASEIRQCWIPESRHHRAFQAEVRRLPDLEPNDILVVLNTPFELGTAQHFSLHSPETAEPFVTWVTGVTPVTVAQGLAHRHGGLRLFLKMNHWKDIVAADIARTHVLIYTAAGRFEKPEWVAQEYPNGRFHLLALKGVSPGAASPDAFYSREQLALLGRRVHFP